jgi:DNA gyrase subunit A
MITPVPPHPTLSQSASGFVKRMPITEFEAQRRGTRGKAGMANLRDGDAVARIFACQTHDTILCISQVRTPLTPAEMLSP